MDISKITRSNFVLFLLVSIVLGMGISFPGSKLIEAVSVYISASPTPIMTFFTALSVGLILMLPFLYLIYWSRTHNLKKSILVLMMEVFVTAAMTFGVILIVGSLSSLF